MAGKNGWRACTVGDIAASQKNSLVGGPFGSDLVSRDYTPTGVPVIRGQNLNIGQWVGGEYVFVSEEKADRLSANLARSGDLLFTQRGNTVLNGGQVAIVPDGAYERYVVSQSQMKLTVNHEQANTRFLYYVFKSPDHRAYLRNNAIVTGVPHTNLGLLRDYPLRLPPLPEQKAIAHILGTLDDKIELNRRMNETLEGMARAIFKSWFVDFDPVRAKMDGRPVPGMDEWQTVQELADQQILLIGDGYRAKRAELGEMGLPFVRAGNLKDHGFDFSNAEILSEPSVQAAGEKISRTNDVAFTSKGTVGRMTMVTAQTRSFVYSPQVCFWRVLDDRAINPHVLYRWMESTEFLGQVAKVKGQTDMAEYVSLRDQRRMRVTLPSIEHQDTISGELAAVDDMIAANLSQSQTLACVRDALLPKLLSGEIRVDEGHAAYRTD